jgi:hypothetical protein
LGLGAASVACDGSQLVGYSTSDASDTVLTMGLTEKDVDDVQEKAAEWKPCWFATEKEYEDALYRHLNDAFKKDKFERQYWRGKTRADIYVEFKEAATVAVELKRDLTERGEYHRLIGQVYEYLTEWKVEALVILCGENDPALVKNVEAFLKFMNAHQGKKARFLHLACSKPPAAPTPTPVTNG